MKHTEIQSLYTKLHSRESRSHSIRKKSLGAVLGSLILFFLMMPALYAGTITVNTSEIGIASDDHCDIVEAIHAANGDTPTEDCAIAEPVGGADTILFAPDIDTITFTAPDNDGIEGDSGGNGLPVITSNITLQGGSGVTLTRNSDVAFRIIEVDGQDAPGVPLTLDNMTLHNGKTNNTFGNSFSGGGLFLHNNAALTVTNSTIISNAAGGDGGGIFASDGSTMTVENSTISLNTAQNDGGGIFATGGTIVVVNNSTMASNIAGRDGGAIWASGGSQVTVEESTLSSNIARDDGGGIFTSYSTLLVVTSSIITSNIAYDYAGGIYSNNSSPMNVYSSVIAHNETSSDGGGLLAWDSSPITVKDSKIFSNTARSHGGGIAARDSSLVDVESSIIMSNTAQRSGGGIFSEDRMIVRNSTLASNVAEGYGGGISASRMINVTNSNFLKNVAIGQGSALHWYAIYQISEATINGSCIVSNSADAIYHSGKPVDINAQSNWWGAADGPGGVTSGSGDAVGSRVDFRNFLTRPPLSCSTPIGPVSGTGDPVGKKVFLPFISGS